ncbi:MAG: hypothetical protein K2K92_00020 [Duncaniella sp.]|nr:hypothetical protein [Duncaniella sp.]
MLMMSLGWTAMWWAYLSGSKQVRKLMETTPCISPIGKKTVIGVATVFLIVIAVNYIARLNYRHDLELRQLESRMRTERLLAEYASNVLDDESLEDSAQEEDEY